MMRNGLAVLLGTLLLAAPVAAKTFEVGESKQYKTLADALEAAADGDRIKVDAGEYFQCAIIRLNDITIEGTGADGSTVFTDTTCGGKAILVAAGDNITIRNMTLQRARVPDKNGAGIRGEGKNLTVEGVKFINNQNGILTGPNPESTITIRNSEFTRNGICDPACAHGIYIGTVKLVRVENSKFSETKQGHHIKSRALRTEVIGCTLVDGPNGTASYMIEIPNGGSVLIRDNTLDKGPKADNRSTAISIGAEGV